MLIRLISVLFFLAFHLLIQAQLPGELDHGYGEDGIKKVVLGNNNAFGQSLVIQPDGKAVVVASSFNGTTNDFSLVRLSADGQIDTEFGDNGMVFTDFNHGNDSPQSITLDNVNRIIVAGYAENNGSFEFGVARYMPDGNLDHSFGDAGRFTLETGITAFAEAVAAQKDLKIVIGGYSFNEVLLENQFTLVRLLENGLPDSSFHHDGIVMTDMGVGGSVANAIWIQDDGKILLAGQVYNDQDFSAYVCIVRYHENGELDNSWGEDGIVFYETPLTQQTITSIAADGEGRVVVGGYHGTAPSNTVFTIARFLIDGTPDDSFGGDGMINDQFGGQENLIQSVVIQGDGKILAGGSVLKGSEVHLAVARVLDDGSFDTDFGDEGVVTLRLGDFGGIKSIKLQDDGKLLVAGESFDGSKFLMTTARFITGLSTSTENILPITNLKLYPNPFTEKLFIEFELLQSADLKIELVDPFGRVVYGASKKNIISGFHHHEIELPLFASTGVYFLKVVAGDKVVSRVVMVI